MINDFDKTTQSKNQVKISKTQNYGPRIHMANRFHLAWENQTTIWNERSCERAFDHYTKNHDQRSRIHHHHHHREHQEQSYLGFLSN